MKALVAAAKAEGTLNVIALPPTWANYQTQISTFSKKYGIKVKSYNPNGTSAQEIQAVQTARGRSSAPDVVDIGQAYTATPGFSKLFAPYKVQAWKQITRLTPRLQCHLG